MNKWIEIKKKQKIIRQILILAKAHAITKRPMQNLKRIKALQAKTSIYMMVQCMLKLTLKKRMRKFAGLTRKHTDLIRDSFVMNQLISTHATQVSAQKAMLLVLEKKKFTYDFKNLFMVMRARVSFIQEKFIDRCVFRDAKDEMLKLYWTKVLAWFVQKGCEMNNS